MTRKAIGVAASFVGLGAVQCVAQKSKRLAPMEWTLQHILHGLKDQSLQPTTSTTSHPGTVHLTESQRLAHQRSAMDDFQKFANLQTIVYFEAEHGYCIIISSAADLQTMPYW